MFELGEYKLRIESAHIIHRNQNVHVALNLIETESGGRVDIRPLWIQGPNAAVGNLADKNQTLLAQLLTLAGLSTSGNVESLISKLTALEFEARLVLDRDKGSGRTYNALDKIYTDEAS